ncbi:MAG: hypothetical protein ACLGHT_03920, partial [Acidimicrobiia bacterium]
LERMVGGDRLIAGIGTGDRVSADENLAFGLDYPPPDERRAALRSVGQTLAARGLTVWIGGGRPATRQVALDGGHVLNLWDEPVDAVAAAAAEGFSVSWAGRVEPGDLSGHLNALEQAGAIWAVASFNPDVEKLAEASAALR